MFYNYKGEEYMLNKKTAEKIIAEVVGTVKEWRGLANRQDISKREIDMSQVC